MAISDTVRPEDQNEPEESGDRIDAFEAEELAEDRPAELRLGDEDVRLPWLEGDDEEEDYRSGGGQFVLLALLALAALVFIIGGIWWFTRDRSDQDLVADGSLIEAPDQPYKEKPADPGGKTFEGTGDTRFAVSEGKDRQAQLGTEREESKPGFESVEKAAEPKSGSTAPAAKPETSESATPAGPAVQVGAYSTRAAADSAWGRLAAQHSVLSGQRYRVVEGRADIGTVYRLQALPGDRASARKLCSDLKASGQDCSIKN